MLFNILIDYDRYFSAKSEGLGCSLFSLSTNLRQVITFVINTPFSSTRSSSDKEKQPAWYALLRLLTNLFDTAMNALSAWINSWFLLFIVFSVLSER